MDVEALQWLIMALMCVSNLCSLIYAIGTRMLLHEHKERKGHDGRN